MLTHPIRNFSLRLILLGACASPVAALAAGPLAHEVPTNVAGVHSFADLPAGFDPFKASPDMLQTYGLPPRPDAVNDAAGFASWSKAMVSMKQHLAPQLEITNIKNEPNKAKGSPRLVADASGVRNSTAASSYNWSGFVRTNSLTGYNSKASYYYIYSDYVIPSVHNASCDGGWDYSSQWVGIDGWSNGDVLQAGTEADAYCSGSTKSTYYAAWYEWYPNYETRISNFPVAAGDDMFVEVWHTSPVQGYAYLVDENTGVYADIGFTAPSGTSLVGNSAEWIYERPGVGGGLATLADAPWDYFSAANAYTFNYARSFPGQTTAYDVTMLDNSGNTYETASLLGLYGMLFTYY